MDLRPAVPLLPLLLLPLSGCASTAPGQAGTAGPPAGRLPQSLDEFPVPDVPVLLIEAEADWDGASAIPEHLQHLAGPTQVPFRFDDANRTLWFDYPEVLWQACRASGAVLVVAHIRSPVVDMTDAKAVYQPPRSGFKVAIDDTTHYGRIFTPTWAQFKAGTSTLGGDAFDVRPGADFRFALHTTRTEVARVGPSNYTDVALGLDYRVVLHHAGSWRLRPSEPVAEAFQNATRLQDRFRETQDGLSAYCGAGP